MSPTAVKELMVRYRPYDDGAAIDGDAFRLTVPTDGERSSIALDAKLARPAVVRDGLLTVAEVMASDLRFKARDRSEYLAYLLRQGKTANRDLWDAQKAFIEAKYGDAQIEEATPLDPVLTVSPDGLSVEAFSADESSYARLHLRADEAYEARASSPGTTYLQLTPSLIRAIDGMRSYRATSLALAPSVAAEASPRRVPFRWIRAFGQVQAASTLPATTFEVAPIDLYNVLLTLRERRARRSPRALRYELVPGEPPRLVLEPWDVVLTATSGPYGGPRPVVVRTWGRKRLLTLSRLLPHARRVTVHLVGAGLPAYYVLETGDATVTLALSGWTDSGWAGIATFDLLAAGPVDDELLPRQLVKRLADLGPMSFDALVADTGRPAADVRTALMIELQRGNVLYDLSIQRFAARGLFTNPPAIDQLRYRDDREAAAHRLLEGDGQVRLTKVHDLGIDGVRIEGEAQDRAAHRTYRTSFTLDREGRTVDAECTSPQFRRAGLREGPTVPMIAIRLLYARQQAELDRARDSVEGRKLIRAETRTFVRRDRWGAQTYRVSLDERQVTVRWGPHPEAMRMQRTFFSTADEARTAYFGRLQELAQRGFIDASAG